MFLFLDSNTYTKNILCCFSDDVAHEIGVTKWFYRKRGNPEQQLITSRKDIASAFKILKSGTLEINFYTNYSGIYTCESEEDNVSFTYVVDGNIFFVSSNVLPITANYFDCYIFVFIFAGIFETDKKPKIGSSKQFIKWDKTIENINEKFLRSQDEPFVSLRKSKITFKLKISWSAWSPCKKYKRNEGIRKNLGNIGCILSQ